MKFEKIKDGKCIQMMHHGSFDLEPESFKIMEAFALENNLTRLAKDHQEIYLSDFRKVATEKLKTVLRFKVRWSKGVSPPRANTFQKIKPEETKIPPRL